MPHPHTVPCRLLVIDDDASYRRAVVALLRSLGHEVAEAGTGAAGLALLREAPVDLVLTDLIMPGLTGWDVASSVKTLDPELPVVLVTGAAHAIRPNQPERDCVDAILGKPCRLADLEAVIGGLARSRSVRRPSGGAGRRDDDPGAVG
jgi:CheY-like chemotaxis protein